MNRFDLAIAPRALQITGAADRETRQIADLWVAMFGADAAWHVARKIDDLSAWGDQTGVSAMRRVLANLERRNTIPSGTGWRGTFRTASRSVADRISRLSGRSAA